MSRKSFRVGKSKTGLGLFATRLIGKGEFVVQYRGKRLTNEEADRRADRGNKYLYELNSRWTIDGKSRKNVARYANHSCRPNAESDVIRGKKIIIRSIKRIQPGEEITYDYGKDYFNLILKPIGCRCEKCVEKRRLERAEKRLKLKRKRAREAKKAAEALDLAAARARKLKAKVENKFNEKAVRVVKTAAKSARRSDMPEPQRKAA